MMSEINLAEYNVDEDYLELVIQVCLYLLIHLLKYISMFTYKFLHNAYKFKFLKHYICMHMYIYLY